VGQRILIREATERRQVVGDPGLDHVREPAALGVRAVLFAVHEDPAVVALTGIRVVERRDRGQVGGAQSGDRRVAVDQDDLLDQVAAFQDPERLLLDDPLRHERALSAVGTDDAAVGAQFVVHQHGDGAVAVVERAEAVGDAHHPVAVVRRVTDRQQGRVHDAGGDGEEVGGLT
jgi:hypothetical protein